MFEDYIALLDKIDRFVERVQAKYPQHIECKPACWYCCVSDISVWRVEFDRIKQFVKDNPTPAKLKEDAEHAKCPFLGNNELCSIYQARPMVCRLWGIPLIFDSETVELSEILAGSFYKKGHIDSEGSKKIFICCPRNFATDQSIEELSITDTINADLVLTTLAAINHVYCEKTGQSPEERLSITKLLDSRDLT